MATAAAASTSNPAASTTTRIRGSVVAHLDTSTPAINATPVEIDGTPTSPEEQQMRKAGLPEPTEGGRKGDGNTKGNSPDYLAREQELLEEFGLASKEGRNGENRNALLQSRKSDPAVLVDIPQGPSVEDFAAAGLLSPADKEKKMEAAR